MTLSEHFKNCNELFKVSNVHVFFSLEFQFAFRMYLSGLERMDWFSFSLIYGYD
jgi:hypothetical protein